MPPEASPRTLPADVAAVTPTASAAESRAHGAADAPATSSAACLTNVLRLVPLIVILRAKILLDLPGVGCRVSSSAGLQLAGNLDIECVLHEHMAAVAFDPDTSGECEQAA